MGCPKNKKKNKNTHEAAYLKLVHPLVWKGSMNKELVPFVFLVTHPLKSAASKWRKGRTLPHS